MTLLIAVLVIALFGPFLTPNDPAAIVGAPGTGPGAGHALGLDYLGRDVLTRVLWGGRSVIWLSLAATALCFAIGLAIGLTAGYAGGIIDPVLMRTVDVVLCFPPLLFFLLVATSVGTSQLTLIVGVAIVLSPGMARIVYSATKETATRGYVEAAVMRGESTPSILRREILPNILPPVIANASRLGQVFLNLLVNAAHAIREKVEHGGPRGTIRISTRADDGLAEIRVADSGTGIPEPIRDKIFDQFFTTKPIGRGTGLGLAIVRAVVVDKHKGSIRFETEPGVGTTFVVRIPVAARSESVPA